MGILLLRVISTVLLITPLSVFALEWSPQLEPAKEEAFRQPTETFRIKIPDSISVETLQTLALELDNIDVTAMVTREGSYAVFTPIQPIIWGNHTLRLVEYTEDGSILEKGFWTFEVRTQSGIRETDFSANVQLSANSRIADNNIGIPEPDKFTAQGSVSLQGKVAGQEWNVSGNMDLIYDSQQTGNNRELDLGEYLITAQNRSAQLYLGHHSLSQTSLAMQNFHRRGASASKGFASINSSVTGFILRTEQISGFTHGLGVSDPDNAVYGLLLENQPISGSPELLYLSATYLSGKSNKVGSSVGAAQADRNGETWSLVADSSLFDQQLRLRGEFASSTTDIITADTTDSDLINAQGDAIAFLVTYSPQSINANSSFFWNTGYEFSRVDTLYSSIANPNLPNDKELNRLFLNANWLGLGAQLSTAIEKDNLDGDTARSQIETKHNQLLLSYGLTEMPQPGSFFDVVGIPTFGFDLRNTNQETIKDATTVTIIPVNIDNNFYKLSADFNKSTWSWGASYSEDEEQDKLDLTGDLSSILKNSELHVRYPINTFLTLSPSVSVIDTKSISGNKSESDIYTLISELHFTDTLNGGINLSQVKDISNSVNSSQDTETSTVSFHLNWNWIQAKNNKPGFNISLSGTYQDTQNNISPANNLDVYQVFLNLSMSLPISSAR